MISPTEHNHHKWSPISTNHLVCLLWCSPGLSSGAHTFHTVHSATLRTSKRTRQKFNPPVQLSWMTTTKRQWNDNKTSHDHTFKQNVHPLFAAVCNSHWKFRCSICVLIAPRLQDKISSLLQYCPPVWSPSTLHANLTITLCIFVAACVNMKLFGERSLSYTGPSVCNCLLQPLHHSDSSSSWTALKTHVFKNKTHNQVYPRHSVCMCGYGVVFCKAPCAPT